MLAELKMTAGCVDCGFDSHSEALDFDHVRGEKIKGVSQMHTKSLENLFDEIAKCDVRCANCHRIQTRGRRIADSGQDH